MYRPLSLEVVWVRRIARGLLAIAGGLGALAIAGGASAGQSPLDQTTPLIWVMTGISVVGAVIVYAILAWAIYKFRDPSAKGRRYG